MKRWQVAFQLVGLGWYVGFSIFLGVVGGRWLDRRLNSGPAFMISGLLLGIVVAFYGAYRMIVPMFTKNGDNDRKGEDRS